MSPRVARQADLQRRILFSVLVASAPSVAELARRVGSTRPATSRALKGLGRLGLVANEGRAWVITAAGRDEAKAISEDLAAADGRARARDDRVGLAMTASLAAAGAGPAARNAGELLVKYRHSGLADVAATFQRSALADVVANADWSGLSAVVANTNGRMSGLADVAGTFQRSPLADVAATFQRGALADVVANADRSGLSAVVANANARMSGLADVAATFQRGALADVVASFERSGVADILATTRADVYHGMARQLSLLAGPPSWWAPVVADNLGVTARIASDIAAMSSSPVLLAGERRFEHVYRAVSNVVSTHHDLLEDSLDRVAASVRDDDTVELIVAPTATTAFFTATARGILVPAEEQRDRADLLRERVFDLAEQLEAAGARASARDLRAAWDVIKTRRPGWPKSGAHLMREVVRELLDALAPRDQVPPDPTGNVTKRAQIQWVAGGEMALTLWLDTTATSVGRLHSLLSAEAKNDGDPRVGWEGLLGVFEVVMGLARTLLEQARRRTHHDA